MCRIILRVEKGSVRNGIKLRHKTDGLYSVGRLVFPAFATHRPPAPDEPALKGARSFKVELGIGFAPRFRGSLPE